MPLQEGKAMQRMQQGLHAGSHSWHNMLVYKDEIRQLENLDMLRKA